MTKLNTLFTLKNVCSLLLERSDKTAYKRDSHDPAVNETFPDRMMSFYIDNCIDPSAITLPDNVKKALHILHKAGCLNVDYNDGKTELFIYLIVLRKYLYMLNGDICNVVLREADNDSINNVKDIPIDDFDHLLKNDAVAKKFNYSPKIKIGYSLLGLGNRWNNFIFYKDREELLIKIEGVLHEACNDDFVGLDVTPNQFRHVLLFFDNKKIIDIENNFLVLNRFNLYQWLSILKNQADLYNTLFDDDDL